MENELVRYSRAGDVFHYRWAARRCLRMIYPKSLLQMVIIEGSKERKLAGEYVIDVAEYSDSPENDSQEITYFQLKHSTIRKDQPFNLSDLKDTVVGFAKRYSAHFCEGISDTDISKVIFSIVTNRPIAEGFKRDIFTIGEGGTVGGRFQKTLESYTNLKDKDINKFCASIKFIDGEGDYNAQRYELHAEISQLLAGTVDKPLIDSVNVLVQEKVLPNSDGRIVREDILRIFGVTCEKDLYPAPPEFEKLDNVIPREQHQLILKCILDATNPIIIHAAGGVGKSVLARQMVKTLPIGSLGVVYDCFGGGQYRNRSGMRHRYRDALVQIINELAVHGLCDPIIAQNTALEDEIIKKFLERLNMAIISLRESNENAILVILIDAADNAEMAANEFGDTCFVHELLREQLPVGCRLVALCRTERIHLLQPSSKIIRLKLEPFSKEETLLHLRRHFLTATEADGQEFYRLTSGNPRVQANVLSSKNKTIAESLASLGPLGTTVDNQIKSQLDTAISAIKETLSINYQSNIDAICVGLATLPPFIPLNVLATVAEVDEATVKSFIADLGRPIWLSDKSVQFRDEPTETWFRERFSANIDQIADYITCLKPLAYKYTYVAETLPSLLLQAEKYNELIDLALSDDLLPKDNPIDERNVRVYRLQFAFKAALKLKRYDDAMKLALRAGEEVAGDTRQLELLSKNVDLIAPLLNEQKVQELAFRHMFRSGWPGSENVYSAALLSSVDSFKGEARCYLRAANNWLQLYFDERKKNKGKYHQERLKDDDIVQLTFIHFNLFGVSKTVDFILNWRPTELAYRITRRFIRLLIDAGDFDAINEISLIDSRSQYLMIALTHELLAVGRFPNANSMVRCLDLLTVSRCRIPKSEHLYNDTTISAIVSFTEACVAMNLSKGKVLRVLNYYVPTRASQFVSGNYQDKERDIYLRAVALRCVLLGNINPKMEELLPKKFIEKKQTYSVNQDVKEFNEIVGGLLPWYIVRANVLAKDINDIFKSIKDADQQSRNARTQRWGDSDIIPYEISQICVDILMIYRSRDSEEVQKLFDDHLKSNKKIRIQDRFRAVRGAFRLDHLTQIRSQLEQSAYGVVNSELTEGPEIRAEWYIELARAVLPVSCDDASVYFDYAIMAVSKFGDEIVQRWKSVVALANRCSEGGHVSPEMAYRFIHCAELVGDNVAREKYFDRDEAIRVCVKLSPISALAGLSRWRERDVGCFNLQLPALANESVKSKYISPLVGWSLSAFFEGYEIENFASNCIEKEPSPVHRKYILETAIRDLGFNDVTKGSWQKLREVAQKYFLKNSKLDDIQDFYENDDEDINKLNSQPYNQEKPETVNWGEIIDGVDLTSSLAIGNALQHFKLSSNTCNSKAFWKEISNHVGEEDVVKYLKALVFAESTSLYDIQDALSSIPEQWNQKVSVKRNWTKILEMISRRFASEFTDEFTLKMFFKDIKLQNNEMPFIHKGVIEGLSNNCNLVDASTFFGFVELATPLISPQQATDLLDFAMTRFELQIDDEYADGCWSSWLTPPEEISMAFAGFVWSALGSPMSETRWRAIHCVRRLFEADCDHEINALIDWMIRGEVGAFGSHKFPFYNLHARLYLLIALARGSINNSQILKGHYDIFAQYALRDIPHILIQKYSSLIAINIENEFPNTYEQNVLEQLHQVGISQIPVEEMSNHREKHESYWHIKGQVDRSLEFHHGYDFDRYWLEPLGDVFGITGKQVEELATEVVIKEWRIGTNASLRNDPRTELWRSQRNERLTSHDHGSYPRADNYSFYLSYHAMFVVAGRLLQKMPCVHVSEWYEDEWSEWLHRHLLTRFDGRWLSDRRDPAPLIRRRWINERKTKNWLMEITPYDFLDGILVERNGETWLNVYGSWEDGDSERSEEFYISSALVSPQASQSLLNALTSCSNPHDFKLPDYEEKRMEYNSYPFELRGWVCRQNKDNRLDEYDPFSGQIAYPPYKIGQSIVEKLGLIVDSEQREWFLPKTKKASLLCELWSTNRTSNDKDSFRHGERLSASLTFLKKLCIDLECELIFEVQINRQLKQKYNRESDDKLEYTPPNCRIYILSADGKLRDAEKNYQLG